MPMLPFHENLHTIIYIYMKETAANMKKYIILLHNQSVYEGFSFTTFLFVCLFVFALVCFDSEFF